MKRIFCFLLTAVLVMGCFSMTATAQELKILSKETVQVALYQENSLQSETEEPTETVLDPRVGILAEGLYEGMKNFETKIDVGDLRIVYEDSADLQALVSEAIQWVKFYVPEFFYVDFGVKYSIWNYTYSDGHFELAYVDGVTYMATPEELPEQTAVYERELKKMINYVSDKGLNDVQKIALIHDYLVAHYEYDLDSKIYDAYGFLTEGKGVCEAYSKTFYALMLRLGIESYCVVDDPHNHAWNVVKLGDDYFHVDCTHDDQTYDRFGMVSSKHQLLLVDDATVVHHHSDQYDWTSPTPGWKILAKNVTCENGEYASAPWHNSAYPLAYCDGDLYMMVNDGLTPDYVSAIASIYRLSADTKQVTKITTTKSPVWVAPNNGIWGSFYSGFFTVGDWLYLNHSDGLWAYNVQNGNTRKVNLPSTQQLYGSRYAGKGMVEFVTKAPNQVNTYLQTYYTHRLIVGDTDGDGLTTAADLVDMRRYLLTALVEGVHEDMLDVNGDYRVNIHDLIHMKKKMLGDIPAF